MAKEFFVILTDGSVDQIVESKASCNKEMRDLRDMGFVPKSKKFATYIEAEKYADKFLTSGG